MQDDDDVKIVFGRPVVAPKVYVSNGPSGWPETFGRADADSALATLVAPVDVSELVDIFLQRREVADVKQPTSWYTIVGYLSRTMQIPISSIPTKAAIAFWGRVVLASISRSVR